MPVLVAENSSVELSTAELASAVRLAVAATESEDLAVERNNWVLWQ